MLAATIATTSAITIASFAVDKAVKDNKTPSFDAEETHIVADNETLWSIAKANLDKSGVEDINEYVFYIKQANSNLENNIYSGQEIVIPVVIAE